MRFHGKQPPKPKPVFAILPRGEDEDIVFRCEAVSDFGPFEKMCPEPRPPVITEVGKRARKDYDDAEYQQRLKTRSERRYAWMNLQSIKNTDGLQWETVDLEKPETWEGYTDEMLEAGFTIAEINELHDRIADACSMSRERLEEARQRFLQSAPLVNNRFGSQRDEPENTLSGALVSD